MESKWWPVGLGILLCLSQAVRLISAIPFISRDETEEAAALRARGWDTVGRAMQLWGLGVLFAPTGLMLAMGLLYLAPGPLATGVQAFGGLVALLGAYFFLAGFSRLALARRLIRDANANPGE